MSRKKSMIEKDDVVQAVIVADNFSKIFAPISEDMPICLLPLVNVPIIDYMLESLALGGINEVFLFCCTHVDQIKEHIRKSKDNSVGWAITMSINIIVSESCRSFGDVMRDLDAKGLLRSDFILFGSNIITNINFLPILEKHKQFSKRDKGAAMTLVYKEAAPGQRGRCSQQEFVLVSDKLTNRILCQHKLSKLPHSSKINIPLDILLEHSKVEIHHDLQETNIAICSPTALSLFSDNFDFQTRDDFVRGLLVDEEITSNTIYWYKTTDYAASVTNWYMYHAVSHDVIHRWVYPLVIEMGISAQEYTYMHLRNNIYRCKNVKLALGSNLEEDVVIGTDSAIAEKTKISRSVIGSRCRIGQNVSIIDSYILDGVTVGDNCKISFSIVGKQSKLGEGVQLSESCVLGTSVFLPDNVKVSSAMIQSTKPAKVKQEDVFGNKAYRVHKFLDDGDDGESDEEIKALIPRLYIESDKSDIESESEESTISDDEMSHMASPVPDDTKMFYSEVIDSLARGFDDKLPCDNLILEINSSRYAYNVTLQEVNYNVMKAILCLPVQVFKEGQYLSTLVNLLKYFLPIIKNYIKNAESMMDCLHATEDAAESYDELLQCSTKVIHWFYDNDILSEETIINWHGKIGSEMEIKEQLLPFIKWLKEAEEETDSDDE